MGQIDHMLRPSKNLQPPFQFLLISQQINIKTMICNNQYYHYYNYHSNSTNSLCHDYQYQIDYNQSYQTSEEHFDYNVKNQYYCNYIISMSISPITFTKYIFRFKQYSYVFRRHSTTTINSTTGRSQ